MKPAVVVGHSGQVSRALGQALQGRKILFTSSSGAEGTWPLNLGDSASILAFFKKLPSHFPQAEIFLVGAMTHVDRCEQEQDACRRINWEGPALVAKLAREQGHGLTYFSTEYVFGGAEYEGGAIGPFTEEDPPFPTSWYGQCKLEAEKAVQATYGENALIVRTTMVYSWDPKGMNFLMQYLRQLESHAKNVSSVFRVPVDQISTPTYAPALAAATVQLRDRALGGVFHLVGPDLLGRDELVVWVAEAFGFGMETARSAFQFVKTKDLGQAAKRPLTAGLSCEKAIRHGLPVVSLSEAFEDVKRLKERT